MMNVKTRLRLIVRVSGTMAIAGVTGGIISSLSRRWTHGRWNFGRVAGAGHERDRGGGGAILLRRTSSRFRRQRDSHSPSIDDGPPAESRLPRAPGAIAGYWRWFSSVVWLHPVTMHETARGLSARFGESCALLVDWQKMRGQEMRALHQARRSQRPAGPAYSPLCKRFWCAHCTPSVDGSCCSGRRCCASNAPPLLSRTRTRSFTCSLGRSTKSSPPCNQTLTESRCPHLQPRPPSAVSARADAIPTSYFSSPASRP